MKAWIPPCVLVLAVAALLLAGAVLALPFTPAGFALIGAVVGFVMIAQMAYLAGTGLPQGAVMGSYNAASYAGMALLPFLAIAAVVLIIAGIIIYRKKTHWDELG